MTKERDIPAEVASALRRDADDEIVQIILALRKLKEKHAGEVLDLMYKKKMARKY